MVKKIRVHLAIIGDKPVNLSLAARHRECIRENTVRLMAAILGFSAVSLQAQVQAGAVFSGDGLSSFSFVVGNYCPPVRRSR